MPRDPRFDILFEPVRIGPVTAPNRFYQVPHCTGMGNLAPATLNAMREVKAEGGWGVVNTEYCSIDPSSDDMAAPFASLWDDGDQRNLAGMVEAVKRHGALAGVELWHGGIRSANTHSRRTPLGPVSLPTAPHPWQAARMDLADLRDLRRWHRAAAIRAVNAGFDIVYVYAAHTYLLAQFLDPDLNDRTDDYGGSLDNRMRLMLEIIADSREAIGHKAALAIRIEVDDEQRTGPAMEADRAETFNRLAPLVDLFDVTIADYSQEMGVSRFIKEGSLEQRIAHVRKLTGKPVVSIGRFTSPEAMLSYVKRGIVDLVGAARPSIADPFLPAKIRDGRQDDIRECIGCNICYAMDGIGVPIRCTQNPAMGEEWRRGWHPERVPARHSDASVLVVGGGPAGLEAAMTLGKRGYRVMLAEAERELGGRIGFESRLPGLAEWARVRDYRVGQIGKLSNVEAFRESQLTAVDVRATGARHVLVATGSRWRTDGRGRSQHRAIPSLVDRRVIAPEVVLSTSLPANSRIVVFDDDHYVTAAALAEHLALAGHQVTYVTTGGKVSEWTEFTAEQARGQRRLIELGVTIVTGTAVSALLPAGVQLTNIYGGAPTELAADLLVPVTSRQPNDGLYRELLADPAANAAVDIATISLIGDARAPGLIAHATHDGHRAARELGLAVAPAPRRERVVIPVSKVTAGWER